MLRFVYSSKSKTVLWTYLEATCNDAKNCDLQSRPRLPTKDAEYWNQTFIIFPTMESAFELSMLWVPHPHHALQSNFR